MTRKQKVGEEMYQALYRVMRPEVFSEILGQEHIVKILKHQIETNSVNHAYLFTGTRGTGKTTTARILAKAVNCAESDPSGRPCGECEACRAIKDGSFLDVIEIDAASNNGVDNIRELRESVKYPPAVGRKKVYIIDEVHMLSSGAFNALLKTLEEPPEYVMFILCTTDPNKLPQTILSRCMRLDFKRVPQQILMDSMKKICLQRGVDINDSALKLLANAADGSVRDGLSILDQVLAAGDRSIDRDKVLEYLGTAGEDFLIELTELVSLKKVPEALILVDGVLSEGKDVKQMMKDWASHYRNLLITKFIRNPEDMLNMSTENVKRLSEQSRHISLEEINEAIVRLSKTINDSRYSTQPRILMELAVVSIATGMDENTAFIPKANQMPGQAYSQISGQLEDAASDHGTGRFQAKAGAGVSEGTIPEKALKPEKTAAFDTIPHERAAGNADAGNASGGNSAGSLLGPAEMETLWHAVFEEGEDGKGSFNLIRNGTALERVDENGFTISVNSTFTAKYVDQNRGLIESIMSSKLGRPVKMRTIMVGENIGNSDNDEFRRQVKEEAFNAASELGLNIKID